MSFHPSEDLLLTSGLDRKAKLIAVRSKAESEHTHKLVQSIFLQDLPIYKCAFVQGGQEAIFCGNRKHFYTYDLRANKVNKVSGILGYDSQKSLSKAFVPSHKS